MNVQESKPMSERSESARELERRINSKEVRLAVVGLGYVGLPLAVEFAKEGIQVVGIDVSQDKIDAVMRGESYVGDVDSAELKQLVDAGLIRASLPGPVLGEVDAISICVPTPLRKSKDPDISFIVSSADAVALHLRRGQLIVLESTTYPGTTEEVILPRLQAKGLVVGQDFFLCFSPERVDPGNPNYNTRNTPKVVGGVTPVCTDLARQLYGHAIDTIVPVSGTQSAEMVKLLENTFRSVNIGLVNELAIMCDRLGANVWEVIGAAATKPFGFMPFWPGPGLGGHCIPIDPHYLSWKLKTLNYHARFIELADEINSHMPTYVVEKVMAALNDRGKPVKGSAILILGLAYKKNVGDCRESPATEILRDLAELGGRMSWCDPHVSAALSGFPEASKVEFSADVLRSFDCVVVVTDHDEFDPGVVVEASDLIVDARNLTKDFDAPAKIWRL